MTSLQEAIKQRRMAEPRVVRCYEWADKPVSMLQVHLGHGEKLVLPWSRFHSAGHRSTNEGEQLDLLFAKHEVILRGVRLTVLLPKIASLHLACVWGESGEFQTKADKNEAFISLIAVRHLADTGGRMAQTF